MIKRTLLAALICLPATQGMATDCSSWGRFSTTSADLEPLSIAAAKIGPHLSEINTSDHVRMSSQLKGGELWLDVDELAGTTSLVAFPRMIFQTGRLADESFDLLVLADGDRGLFSLKETELRAMGCQFIWGREGGQNPIALMRDLYKSMRHYETDQLISTHFNGSLLGDTNLALRLNNEVVLPAWIKSAIN
jgi:hypothetical protein